MSSSESKRERLARIFKSDKSKKEAVPDPLPVRRLQHPAGEVGSTVTQQPVESSSSQTQSSEVPVDQRSQSLEISESTWDRAEELLRQRKPELYNDLQDLRNVEGFLSSSDWLEKELAVCKETRNEAHARSRTNAEKILRSILLYKDVAVAVSRLDPHGVAPMVLNGFCAVVQAALNDFKNHEEVTTAVDKIAALIAFWTNQEERSLFHQDITLKNDFSKLQTSLADLYASILECQISLTRYYKGSIFRRVVSAAYSPDILRTQLTAIKDKDNNCKSYSSIIDAETAFQKRNADILQWISPTDPMLMHEGIISRTKIKAKYTDSGEWLLQCPEFVNWDNRDNKEQVLWLFGTVGTGKTTLMSKLVEWHLSRSSLYKKTSFAIYYCSDSSGQRSSDSAVILRSLVRQLSWCLASTKISEPVQTIYERLKRDRPKDGLLSHEDCEKVLQAIFKSHVDARICIDALDECDDPEEVLSVLRAISIAGNGTIKICICSRTDLRHRAEHFFPDACFLEVATAKTRADMETYIRREVQERDGYLRLLGGKRPDLENKLVYILSQRAGGMFRWVELQMSLFLDRRRPFKHPGDVEDSLKTLEKVSVAGDVELSKTYCEILDRNAAPGRRDRKYAQAAYSLVLCAFRVMTLDDIAMTIKWLCANDEDDDGNSDDAVTPQYVSEICRDCLTEASSKVVEFAHVSVKEFLQNLKNGDEAEYSLERCHHLIAKICLRYLLRTEQSLTDSGGTRGYSTPMTQEDDNGEYHESEDNDESGESDENGMLDPNPYAEYYWAAHVKFVDSCMSNDLGVKFSMFMSLDLEPSHAYERWASAIRSFDRSQSLEFRLRTDEDHLFGNKLQSAVSLPTTPVAAICAFGFASMVNTLNSLSSFDWNREQSTRGRTTKMLNINSQDGTGQITKFLLARKNIEVNWAEGDGWTALIHAMYNGSAPVVKLLLAHPNIDVNWADETGWTALIQATSNGSAPVVKLLLAHPNIDVNLADEKGRTALIEATVRGYVPVVELLLAHPNIDVNLVDKKGGTALQHAAYKRGAAIVRLLLAQPNIDVNLADEEGRTPLYQAAKGGDGVVLGLILAQPNIDRNLADMRGRTALDIAGIFDNVAAVTLLEGENTQSY